MSSILELAACNILCNLGHIFFKEKLYCYVLLQDRFDNALLTSSYFIRFRSRSVVSG